MSQAFDALQPTVENADGAPTPDVLKGYALQQRNADAVLASWAAVKADKLPPLDAELQKAGRPTLGSKH